MLEEWLDGLRIDQMCQWDVLVFLHRHRTTLLSAEQIARLMPYGTGLVVAALDHLESHGIVERSRLSQGARLYEVAGLDGPRARAFDELLALTETRAGRLAMVHQLREVSQSKPAVSMAQLVGMKGARGKSNSPYSGSREGGKWPQAI